MVASCWQADPRASSDSRSEDSAGQLPTVRLPSRDPHACYRVRSLMALSTLRPAVADARYRSRGRRRPRRVELKVKTVAWRFAMHASATAPLRNRALTRERERGLLLRAEDEPARRGASERWTRGRDRAKHRRGEARASTGEPEGDPAMHREPTRARDAPRSERDLQNPYRRLICAVRVGPPLKISVRTRSLTHCNRRLIALRRRIIEVRFVRGVGR
jgi:hypothetical protein